MRKITKKVKLENGDVIREPVDIKKRLGLSYLDLVNQTYLVGQYDMPMIYCATKVSPDFLALYSQKNLYNTSPQTVICFYEYDDIFDGANGLYNAIYYNRKKQLDKFRSRFKDKTLFISPDYSVFGDIDFTENLYRIKKARVVSLWLALELDAIVIPNVPILPERYFDVCTAGLENCEVVAINLVGHITNHDEKEATKSMVKHVVDTLPLKKIIVYDTSVDDRNVKEIFDYAIKHNITIVAPDNTLKTRHIQLTKTAPPNY